jgi:hypothetical protein
MYQVKLILILTLFPFLLFGQSFTTKEKKDIMTSGIVLTTGGVALTLGSAFTPSEVQWSDGRWRPMPIYSQDARFAGIVTGCAITATGVISIIAGNEPKTNRRKK